MVVKVWNCYQYVVKKTFTGEYLHINYDTTENVHTFTIVYYYTQLHSTILDYNGLN